MPLLRIVAPHRVEGEAGSAVRFEAQVELDLSGAAQGPQGWSLAILAEGCRFAAATLAGTAGDTLENGGLRDPAAPGSFEWTEIVNLSGPVGVVSAVIPGGDPPVVLEPSVDPYRLLSLQVEASAPPRITSPCEECRLLYAENLEGSQGTVSNGLLYEDGSLTPVLEDGGTFVCPRAPFHLSFGGELEAVIPAGTEVAELGPVVYLDAEIPGVQGWSMSVESSGDCELVEATTSGTAGADSRLDPEGFMRDGFERTDIVDPARNGGRRGAVSAVVLSLVDPVTLPAGRHPLLSLRVACDTAGLAPKAEVLHELRFPPNEGTPPPRWTPFRPR